MTSQILLAAIGRGADNVYQVPPSAELRQVILELDSTSLHLYRRRNLKETSIYFTSTVNLAA